LFKIDKTFIRYLFIIFTVLVIDHVIKIIVYSNLELHEGVNLIGNRFRIQLELHDDTAFAILTTIGLFTIKKGKVLEKSIITK